MIETMMTIYEAAKMGLDAYKCVNTLIFGDTKKQYLQQMAADMKDMKTHIECLSDNILYAGNFDGVRATGDQDQHYIKDYREIRQLLDPIQTALKKPILSSALISAPAPIELGNPRQFLSEITPIEQLPEFFFDDFVPVLFKDGDIYYVGWQHVTYLSDQLDCHYLPDWQPNHNQLPGQNTVNIGQLLGKLDEVFCDRLSDGSDGPEMVWIEAGRFKMGDIQGTGEDDEKPVHEVSVERLAMGRYPVTFAEYDQFADATGKEKPDDRGWGRDNRPVIYVSWNDAVAYTEWLSTQTGLQYRLPTEAEWEYAARAGTETDYWWGNEIGKNRANFRDSGSEWSGKQTSPVGSFEPNPFGLYDTVGNVWEWVRDWYDSSYYSNSPPHDPKGPTYGRSRVLRGCAWGKAASDCRAALRCDSGPGYRLNCLGFRLLRLP
jgi:formylglycine-generating enzyme required for sulfatase activity